MGTSGAAYQYGLLGVIADPLGAVLVLFLIGLFFARLFRRLRILTVADFMAQRYGQVAAMAITLVTLFANIMWVGGMLVAFGLIFETLTGTPFVAGVVGGALVIVIYTAVGGMWAVALTDFLQLIVIVIGLVVLLTVVLIDVGGWGTIAARLPEGTFRLIPDENTAEQWLNYLRAWLIIGLVDISSQTLTQRALAAKSERVAQNSFYLGAIGYLVFGMIPVILGLIASVTMPGINQPEALVPTLAIEHLHPVAVADLRRCSARGDHEYRGQRAIGQFQRPDAERPAACQAQPVHATRPDCCTLRDFCVCRHSHSYRPQVPGRFRSHSRLEHPRHGRPSSCRSSSACGGKKRIALVLCQRWLRV